MYLAFIAQWIFILHNLGKHEKLLAFFRVKIKIY